MNAYRKDEAEKVLQEKGNPVKTKDPATERPMSAKKQVRILVVDDNMTISVLLTRIIQSFKHECELAACGEEALERYKQGGIDIVFTDLTMPGMDGYELIEKLKQLDPTLIIVAVTANSALVPDEFISETGVFGLITKPFMMDQILDTINKAIEKMGR